jgi:hypothetical protein
VLVVVVSEPVLLWAEAGRLNGTVATLAAITPALINLESFENFMIKGLFLSVLSLIYRFQIEW